MAMRSFTTLQAGQAHPDLVLQQLTHAAQAAVAQMVDVIGLANAVEQAGLVVGGGHDVVHQDILGVRTCNFCFRVSIKGPPSSTGL